MTADDDDYEWEEVPESLRSFVLSLLRRERAALDVKLAEAKASSQVMSSTLADTMKKAMSAMSPLESVKAEKRFEVGMAQVASGISDMTDAVDGAKIAAIESAISCLSRKPLA